MKKATSLFFLLILSACGLDQQLTRKIRIDMDALNSEVKPVQSRHVSTSAYLPAKISDFKCFFVNIKNGGISGGGNSKFGDSKTCLGLNLVSNAVNKTTLINDGVTVSNFTRPDGDFMVEVYGIVGDSVTETNCESVFSTSTTKPKVIKVATKSVSLSELDKTITAASVYEPATSQDIYQRECNPILFPAKAYFWRPTNNYMGSADPDYVTAPSIPSSSPVLITSDEIFSPTTGENVYTKSVTGSFVSGGNNIFVLDLLFDVKDLNTEKITRMEVKHNSTISCSSGLSCPTLIRSTVYYKTATAPFTCVTGSTSCTTGTILPAVINNFIFAIDVALSGTNSVTRQFVHASIRTGPVQDTSSITGTVTFTVNDPKLVITY